MRFQSVILLAGLAAAVPAKPQSLDQILDHYVQAAGGKDALEKITSRTMKGTLENSDDGTTSPAEVFAKPDKFLSVVDLGGSGKMFEAWTGSGGWTKDPDSGLHDMSKQDVTAARRDYEFYRELKLKELFPKMTLAGKARIGDSDAYLVEASTADGATEKLYFDVQSGLLVRREFERINIDDGIVLWEVDYDDYKDVDGVKVPAVVVRKTPDFSLTWRFSEIKNNVPIDDASFNKPEK
ncbi:MAG TPA: hypothetical protein VJN43_00160 [Bryobacteraceae bacterium]|nr:hypothetical protein [Bryobacteraceae bacterium]